MFDGFAINTHGGAGWSREAARDVYFWRVAEGMANANAPAFDDTDSPMRIGSWDHWERGMAISAASSSVVAENHGCEFGGRGGVVFLLSCRKKKCSCRLSALITRHAR